MGRLTKTDERYLKRCRDRIESAKKFRKHEGLDDLWKRLVDLYRGKHFPKGLQAEDRIVVNLAFSTINVISPSVSVNHPKITVQARKPDDEDRATITEAVINYWWKHFDVHAEFRLAVDDFLILGFGWLKTGYRYVEEQQPDPQGHDQQAADQIAQADQFAADNPHLAGGLPTDQQIHELVPSTKLQVVEDRPFVERVSVHDVYVDPEGTSMRDITWIAQRIERSLDEVRNDDAYDATARKKAQATGHIDESRRPKVDDRDACWQRCDVWEFYDLKNGTMTVFAESGEGFLIEPTAQPYKFGHPFVMLRNYDVPDVFYPMGELEAIEPLQHELNATRTAQLNDRKQKRRAWLYDERAFDKRGKRMLMSNDDNRMIPVTGNVPLNEAVEPLPSQQLDAQLYQNSDVITNDINQITAVGEYMRGAMPEIRRTATEASIIQDAANSRAADKLSKIESIIAIVARRLIMLAEQYMTESQVVRVLGVNGMPVWAKFEPDDIAGEYDFDVEGGSTQPMNEQGRRQQATQVMQTVGPLFGQGLVNEPEVLRWALEQFGIKNASRFVAPPAPPPGAEPVPPTPGANGGPPTQQAQAPQGPPQQSDPTQGGPQSQDAGASLGMPPGVAAQLAGQVGLNVGG